MTSPLLRCTTENLPGIGTQYIAGGSGLAAIVNTVTPMTQPIPAAFDDVSGCVAAVFCGAAVPIIGTTNDAVGKLDGGGAVHVEVSVAYTTTDVGNGGEITCQSTNFPV
ncbi:hypothetical protein [Nocardia sp. NPDC057440]|uniref:hypothetical protein n=1 Tax=Nocardia sp. NPDC057440 TaxID=3346134 RepID=UPI003671D063